MLGQRPRLKRSLEGVTGELPRAWSTGAWVALVLLLGVGLISGLTALGSAAAWSFGDVLELKGGACLTHPRWDGTRRSIGGLSCTEEITEYQLYNLDLERAALGRRAAHLHELEPTYADYDRGWSPSRMQTNFQLQAVQRAYDGMSESDRALVDRFFYTPEPLDGPPGMQGPLTWDEVVREGPAALSGRVSDLRAEPAPAPGMTSEIVSMNPDDPVLRAAERRTHAELLAAKPLFDELFDVADAHQLARFQQLEPEARAWRDQVVATRTGLWWTMVISGGLSLILLVLGGVRASQALSSRRVRVAAGPSVLRIGEQTVSWDDVNRVSIDEHRVRVTLTDGRTVSSPRLTMHPQIAAELQAVVEERLAAFRGREAAEPELEALTVMRRDGAAAKREGPRGA